MDEESQGQYRKAVQQLIDSGFYPEGSLKIHCDNPPAVKLFESIAVGLAVNLGANEEKIRRRLGYGDLTTDGPRKHDIPGQPDITQSGHYIGFKIEPENLKVTDIAALGAAVYAMSQMMDGINTYFTNQPGGSFGLEARNSEMLIRALKALGKNLDDMPLPDNFRIEAKEAYADLTRKGTGSELVRR